MPVIIDLIQVRLTRRFINSST